MRIDGRTLLRAWRLAAGAGIDLFRPGVAELLPRLPGWDALVGARADLIGTPRVGILDALRAIELQARERASASGTTQLVATLPGGGLGLPATRDAVRALLRGAEKELLVLGFSVTDEEFRDLVLRRGSAGVRVTIVGDRISGGARDLWRSWPPGAAPLDAFEDVEPERDQHRRMHGKVVVADRRRALIGSANFTASGLGANFEFGVLVEGELPEKIVATVSRMVADGWLTKIGGGGRATS